MGKEARLEMRPSNRASHGNLKHEEYQALWLCVIPERVHLYFPLSPHLSSSPKVIKAPDLSKLSSPLLGWLPEGSLTRSQS